MEDEELLKQKPKPNPVREADLQLVKSGKQSIVSGGSMLPGRLRAKGISEISPASTAPSSKPLTKAPKLSNSLSPSPKFKYSSNTSKSSGYTSWTTPSKDIERDKNTKLNIERDNAGNTTFSKEQNIVVNKFLDKSKPYQKHTIRSKNVTTNANTNKDGSASFSKIKNKNQNQLVPSYSPFLNINKEKSLNVNKTTDGEITLIYHT